MSLIFFDGMDYRSNPVPPWTSSTGVSIDPSAVRTGINGLQGGSNGAISYAIDTSMVSTEYIVGFAAKGMTTTFFVEFSNNNFADIQWTFRFNETSRSIEAYLGNNASNAYRSPVNAFDPSIWNYFEFRYKMAQGTGSFEVRVNGATIYSQSNITTQNVINAAYASGPDGLRINMRSTAHKLDDFYFLNTAGTLNNTFLGDSRVDILVPSGPGTYTQLTPFGSANNWDNVNEAPPNTSDYNYTDVPDSMDTYAFTDLPASVIAVGGVQVHTYAAKTNTGTRSIVPIVYASGIVASGSEFALSQSYSYYTQLFERNPVTTSGWTASGINAAEFGIKVR